MDGGTNEKRKISVRAAGRFLTLVTEEDEADVRRIERELDTRVSELVRSSPRLATKEGKIDAVLLCAIDALDREMKTRRALEEKEKELAAAERRLLALSGEYGRLAANLGQGKDRGTGEALPGTRAEKTARCLELIENERRRTREEHK